MPHVLISVLSLLAEHSTRCMYLHNTPHSVPALWCLWTSVTVIDSLDGMKKGRENYAAREAIKFLEKSLEGGGRLVRVQKDTETLQPGRRKPPRQDLQTWCVLACMCECMSTMSFCSAFPQVVHCTHTPLLLIMCNESLWSASPASFLLINTTVHSVFVTVCGCDKENAQQGLSFSHSPDFPIDK